MQELKRRKRKQLDDHDHFGASSGSQCLYLQQQKHPPSKNHEHKLQLAS